MSRQGSGGTSVGRRADEQVGRLPIVVARQHNRLRQPARRHNRARDPRSHVACSRNSMWQGGGMRNRVKKDGGGLCGRGEIGKEGAMRAGGEREGRAIRGRARKRGGLCGHRKKAQSPCHGKGGRHSHLVVGRGDGTVTSSWEWGDGTVTSSWEWGTAESLYPITQSQVFQAQF
eukprot:361949-Chlamydomonas_euryale.AAC.3